MNVYEMVAMVVVFSVVGGVIKQYLQRHRYTGPEEKIDEIITQKMNGVDFEKILKTMLAMEDRIQVLERIATDKGVALKSEINNL